MTEVDSDVARTPLCVDLDGTLLLGDVGIESALALIKQNPLYLFAMLLWLLRGYAVLKRNIAQRVTLNAATLPYDARVLEWVRTEKATRPCVLATASDALLVQPIADHLDCFSEILASDGVTNLAGSAKARALETRFGKGGFDYAGNSSSDLAVWPHARTVIVANPSAPLLRHIRNAFSIGKLFPRQTRGLRTWARALRLHQWVKNLLLFVPLIGAHRLEDGALVAQCLVAWMLFGMCTSGTYLGNDLLDLDADRRHPRKKFRPLASGRLPVQDGLIAANGLIAGSFLAALLLLPFAFSGWLAAYLLLTLTYSLRLKRIIVVDVMVLAVLFTLRILAGGGATGVPVSPWLLALSLLTFFGLGLVKRYAELHDLVTDKVDQARGRGYRARHLSMVWWLGISASLAGITVLGLYIESPTSHALYRNQGLLWLLCPLLAFWIGRVWWLAKAGRMHDDPIMFATRDITSWIVLVTSGIIVWAAS